MPSPEPCLCGATDCQRCFPGNREVPESVREAAASHALAHPDRGEYFADLCLEGLSNEDWGLIYDALRSQDYAKAGRMLLNGKIARLMEQWHDDRAEDLIELAMTGGVA